MDAISHIAQEKSIPRVTAQKGVLPLRSDALPSFH